MADDYSESPQAQRARELKAIELEQLAVDAGYSAADLADDEVWAKLLKALSVQRGKPVTSKGNKTRRLVWRMLRDRELHRGGVLRQAG